MLRETPGVTPGSNARSVLKRSIALNPGVLARGGKPVAPPRHVAGATSNTSSFRHAALQRQQPRMGSSSSSCRAAGVLEGSRTAPAGPAAAEVGGSLLRQWLGLPADAELPMTQETGPVRDTSCNLTVCATSITCGERKHVLLAFVATNEAETSSNSSRRSSDKPGSAGVSLADLLSPVLHWGCTGGHADRWQPPPAGWSTWPDVSHDARGGAWQTPCTEQLLPDGTPALTLLLQLPCEGPIRNGGLAFILKSGNSWLGNAATFSDFYFSTGSVPGLSVEALAAAEGTAVATEKASLLGPEQRLDLKRLAATPVSTWTSGTTTTTANNNDRRKQKKQGNQGWQQQEQHHQQRHGQEPELPNAGRRAKEPPTDETQVCKLSAAELHAAAAAQLSAWAEQQGDLELPAAGLQVTQHEFPVKGHPSTPFVMATAAVWQKLDPLLAAPDTQAADGGRQAVLLLAAMGDVGLTGIRMPGLVLHWSAVAAPDAAGAAAELAEVAAGAAEVAVLPEGWTTLPDLSWDAGSGFWETPMTRHLLAATTAPAVAATTAPAVAASSAAASGAASQLERPATPRPAGTAGAGAADMYLVLLRLPLQGVFRTGGLLFNMRTSRRQWVRDAATGGTFFINTSSHAQQLGLLPPPAPSAAAADAGAAQPQQQPPLVLDEASHKALAAAGLSEQEILAFAASMPQPSSAQGAAAAGLAGGSSTAAAAVSQALPKASLDALSSADADMSAHIEAISANRRCAAQADSRSSAGTGASKKPGAASGGGGGGAEPEAAASAAGLSTGQLFGPGGVARFLRGFEPAAVNGSDLAWGCGASEGDTSR